MYNLLGAIVCRLSLQHSATKKRCAFNIFPNFSPFTGGPAIFVVSWALVKAFAVESKSIHGVEEVSNIHKKFILVIDFSETERTTNFEESKLICHYCNYHCLRLTYICMRRIYFG